MPVPGRKPKAEGQSRNRHRPEHEWTEVPASPFEGRPPVTLPTKRTVVMDGAACEVRLSRLTRDWWRRISRMPHCRIWTESDWSFALATALVADAFFSGQVTAAAELRQREKILGTTADARRDLRIRYVEPEPEPGPEAAGVARLDDYRDL